MEERRAVWKNHYKENVKPQRSFPWNWAFTTLATCLNNTDVF